ncbi:MAG: ketopantoate reductase family protein, partial [Gemmatimonadota bacterium]|nr:ketopantoate reductase family protein [Gemmatimonadota bacterium]
MKLLVLGAGAIGGYFGGRLADAGADVTFLVRSRRREQLARDGLVIVSPSGDLKMPVKTVSSDELRADYDVVLLTCKSYDLESAMDAIAPAMVGSCSVIPVLNGMSHMQTLDARFGRENVLGGLAAIVATLKKDGTIVHGSPMQRIVFGARDGGTSPHAKAFADALATTSVSWELSSRIEQDMWEKIVFLSAAAAVTCLFRANIAEIMASAGGRAAIERTLNANIEIAAHEGYPLREAALQFSRATLLTPSALTASMLRDLESGNPVESD